MQILNSDRWEGGEEERKEKERRIKEGVRWWCLLVVLRLVEGRKKKKEKEKEKEKENKKIKEKILQILKSRKIFVQFLQ